MKCRYDKEADDYLIDGEPCRRDEYGDPTYHCTARRTCRNHIGRDERTCHGCISSARTAITRIVELEALVQSSAEESGRVDREANEQAGTTANPVRHWWRRINQRRDIEAMDLTGESWVGLHAALADDDIDTAESLLVTWEAMIREDYGHDSEHFTLSTAVGYLDRHLVRIAQDPTQDFPLLMRELRDCASRLEVAVSDSTRPVRGVPCPECVATGNGAPRLVRHYGHWCEDEGCENIHYQDDSGDEWVCPKNAEHKWTHERYENHVRPRKASA